VGEFLRRVSDAYVERLGMSDADAQTRNAAILSRVKRLRDLHLQRMTENPLNPSLSLIFTGLLTDYSRIRAHALNLHEAIAEGAQASAA
jgi:Na+/phosphate symporter